ncbi:hypothetical protein THAOC_15930 [Thalassiosira oceanica]|uniref:Uncharacterized protein n=1 Tax=Thalassiosira oceanica TaxID=159749 RepID=K0SB93_THAOC|nr:hypothetical protein THAOC_15930 [Thalassiosira oceanica]|eukprot:EJK63408.1 hypothetical protein THAOC_15930 [Thalassiosira oceanica]
MTASARYKPRFRQQCPRSTVPGFCRMRLDSQRPRIDGHFRSEAQLHQHAKSFGSHPGGYWIGEAVDHRDLERFPRPLLKEDRLGLYHGDQVAVLFRGCWTAGFVGITGDPHNAWPTMFSAPERVYDEQWNETLIPQPDEPFIDVTFQVADGLGSTWSPQGQRLPKLVTDPRRSREYFCCSYKVARVYQSQWRYYLAQIDGATVIKNRESNEVLHRLLSTPSRVEDFIHEMQHPQRHPEETFDGRCFGRRWPPRAGDRRDSLRTLRGRPGFHRGRYAFEAPSDQERWPRARSIRKEPFVGRWGDSHSPRADSTPPSRGRSEVDANAQRGSATRWRCRESTDELQPKVAPLPKPKSAESSKPAVTPAPASSSKSTAGFKSCLKSKPTPPSKSAASLPPKPLSVSSSEPTAAGPKISVTLRPTVKPEPALKPESTLAGNLAAVAPSSAVVPRTTIESASSAVTPKPPLLPRTAPALATAVSFGVNVGECIRKYDAQPRRRKESKNTRKPTRPEVGDDFKAGRSVQHEVNPAARRRLASLDRRDLRRRTRSGLRPTTRQPSVSFSRFDDEVYFAGEQAHLSGTISLPPDLVDSFLLDPCLTLCPSQAIVTKPARTLPTPRVRQPLPIAPPTLADSPDTEDTGVDQSPPMESSAHSPEGAIDLIDDVPVATSSKANVSPDVSQVSGVTAGPDDTTQPGSRGSNLSTQFQTLLSRWNRTWQAR